MPAAAIADMQKDGAGFAGFATWLDMTPAHPDLFAMPDPDSVIQLPRKKEDAWILRFAQDTVFLLLFVHKKKTSYSPVATALMMTWAWA